MTVTDELSARSVEEQTSHMLHELGIAIHRHGYTQLCIGIPRFAEDSTQGICKELYPYIAALLDFTDWHAVERSIRSVIIDGWNHGDHDAWSRYFPNCRKPPSNKQFIATLAARLRK